MGIQLWASWQANNGWTQEASGRPQITSKSIAVPCAMLVVTIGLLVDNDSCYKLMTLVEDWP